MPRESEQAGLRPASELRIELIEESPGVFQVGGLETLSELAIDSRKRIARIAATSLLDAQPG